ncbi:alpha/beta hydrolase [Rhodanobacter sp. L36]|uniref:serine aminopeptidase domain-containing protein n=1 Tax=Rhodanobacter sp. L36 TaxID=1747221 RepID=UPI00131C9693|nr:alpha/beta hydrolase [Rhodanobacter sp. L36]
MMVEAEAEIPFHFGTGAKLFGLYHPAAAPTKKSVLLCPPFGQDLIRTHRLYRQLAQTLAAAGIAVMRFDYSGSGDSAGSSIDVDWNQCIADTVAAADELRVRSHCETVAAFGARLGANVAMASATHARFADLMLWDPITNAAAHIARLDAMQNALQHDTNRFLKSRPATSVADQWLGFPVSPMLRQQLLDLRVVPPDGPTLLVDSRADESTVWNEHTAPSTKTIKLPRTPWDDPERLELAILSHELIQAIATHMQEAR